VLLTGGEHGWGGWPGMASSAAPACWRCRRCSRSMGCGLPAGRFADQRGQRRSWARRREW